MNGGQLINMIIKMVMRRVMRQGMNAGIDAVGKRMNKGKTAEDRSEGPDTRQAAKRAKQTMRMARKIGRF